jgi:hypothetical protein
MRPPWLLSLVLCGCATARLAQSPSSFPADPGAARTVVLEPLFELADWQTSTRTEYAQVSGLNSGMSGYGYGYSGLGSGPSTVAISRQVQEKPLFARPAMLTELHRQLLVEVQRRRPSWRVTSTAGAPLLGGEVTVVRTIIEGNQTITSDRTLKNLALGFGFVIWPLQLIHLDPVHETERVAGTLERFGLAAEQLRTRLVRYPTQPDYAVNLAGLEPLRRGFGLEVSYTEGILASETPRTGVLTTGLVDRLASAVLAVVEEVPPPARAPAPPPATPARLREDAP